MAIFRMWENMKGMLRGRKNKMCLRGWPSWYIIVRIDEFQSRFATLGVLYGEVNRLQRLFATVSRGVLTLLLCFMFVPYRWRFHQTQPGIATHQPRVERLAAFATNGGRGDAGAIELIWRCLWY